MQNALARFSLPDKDPTELFIQLIAEIRPHNLHDSDSARRNLQALCHLLNTQPGLRKHVREALAVLSHNHRHSELYTSTGILPNTGFFSEIFRRIGHKILPEAVDHNLLRTALRKIFSNPGDQHWVIRVGNDAWLQVINALHFEEREPPPEMPRPLGEILRSLRVISYWITACGMEPELLRLEPALENYESPFIAQNQELIAYIETYPLAWRKTAALIIDDKHLRVLLDQCLQVIEKIRKRAVRDGTSIPLTYHLQRLQQLIQRCEQLLDIVDSLLHDPDGQSALPAIVTLFTHLIREECLRNNLVQHWRRNTELIALRVTDNASIHGEHYITETPSEYLAMARSAAIGGLVIGFMACLKILLSKSDMPPLSGALVFCLNYGLGFCLIHILHGTVATKQPAMTANAIAATISQSEGKLRDIEVLAALIARTVRSQLVAILGNIGIAIPLAALIAWLVLWLTGEPFTSPEKSLHLLEDQSLIYSGSLFYAAIAGICLFFAGLINGYYDNYAAYNRIPERLLQLEWAQKLLGESRLYRISTYIGNNLGALTGNLVFGFLLGGTTIFGVLFGLPIDIRHVAFSSAFIGIAFVGLDFAPDFWMLLWAALGVIGIGLTNLIVSFALALNVALRARQVSDKPWRQIIRAVLQHLVKHPKDFILPPRCSSSTVAESDAPQPDH